MQGPLNIDILEYFIKLHFTADEELQLIEYVDNSTNSEEHDFIISYYLVRSRYNDAISDCNIILDKQPKNVKALWRRGMSNKALSRYNDAINGNQCTNNSRFKTHTNNKHQTTACVLFKQPKTVKLT